MLAGAGEEEQAYSAEAGDPVDDVAGMGAARPGSAGVGRQVIREFAKADVAGGRTPGFICLKNLEVGELGLEMHVRADWIGAAPKCGLGCRCGWSGAGGGMGGHGEALGAAR